MGEKNSKPRMVLLMNLKVNIFNSLYCYLIFACHEIILAILDKEKEIELFNIWQRKRCDNDYEVDFLDFLRKYSEKYYEISIEEILEEDRRNIKLNSIDVIKIRFKASRRSDSFINKEVGRLTLKTTHKKFKFIHHYRDWNRNIFRVLFTLYGNKVKYIEGDLALSPIFKEGREGFY